LDSPYPFTLANRTANSELLKKHEQHKQVININNDQTKTQKYEGKNKKKTRKKTKQKKNKKKTK
jgi:hypothetical protein